MNENETKLASEIIHEQKVANKRMFIILMVVLTMFFVSNLAWLVAWNLPDSKTVQSYEMAGEDNANVVYNEEGDVKINGNEDQGQENNDITGEQQTAQQ
jgi:flagellar basal body-associated protein FliL